MDIEKLEKAAKPEQFAGYIVRLSQLHDHDLGHGGDGSIETLREDHYKGHHITIRTTYKIEVNARALQLPLGLDNDGNLHCHSLPNYQFASALDMVKRLIDNFPEDFRRKKREAKKPSDRRIGHVSHKRAKNGGK
jgi:hypothetical protein